MALLLSRTVAPQGRAVPWPWWDPGAALWHRAMSSPGGCQGSLRGQGAPGASGPLGLTGQGRAPSDPLSTPRLWSPLVSSPSLLSLPRAAPPWKQEQEVRRAQPAAPRARHPPLPRESPGSSGSSEGRDPSPGGCRYLWQAAGQLRLCSSTGRGGSGPLGCCCLSIAFAAFSPSP